MICDICGGTESYISGGTEYCRECSLQVKGSRDEEKDESFSKKSQFSSPKVEKTKNDKKKLFAPWLSFEAFTYILSKQVSALIDLGCSESLKTIVMSLWFRYLQKCEVAFIKFDGNEDFLPRLSYWPSKRDVQLLYGDGSATKKYRKRPTKKMKSKAAINSQRKAVKKEVNPTETGDYTEASESANEKQNGCDEKTATRNFKKNKKKQFKPNSNDSTSEDLEVSDETCSDESAVSSTQSSSKQQKKLRPKYSIHARKLKKKGFKGENSKDVHIHHMTLNKTVSFCYLGLLYSGDQLLMWDLIRLLNDGIIPFVDVTRHFPLQMQLLADDFYYFMKYSAPDMKSVYSTSSQLVEFLKLPAFKKPSLLQIAIRFVKDLNLPCDIIPVLKLLIKKLDEKADKLSDYVSSIPMYEAQAMSVLAVALKMLFVLDGKFEVEHSEIMTKINSVTTDHKFFIWKQWQQQASLKEYLFLKNLSANTKEMNRLDSLCAARIGKYPFNIVRPELITLQNKDCKDKASARNELKTLFKDLVSNEIFPRKPTSFPLQSEITNLMNEWERLSLFKETKHIDFSFISEDFSSHKLYYRPSEIDSTFDEPIKILLSTLYESVKLFHISDTSDYLENVIRTTKKYWYINHQNIRISSRKKWIDDFPSSFKWLLNFICKYLQIEPWEFYQEFRSIERKLIVE